MNFLRAFKIHSQTCANVPSINLLTSCVPRLIWIHMLVKFLQLLRYETCTFLQKILWNCHHVHPLSHSITSNNFLYKLSLVLLTGWTAEICMWSPIWTSEARRQSITEELPTLQIARHKVDLSKLSLQSNFTAYLCKVIWQTQLLDREACAQSF